MNGDCDVLVIGAGPAGLAAAMTLARRGKSVVLVDADGRNGFAEDGAATLSLRVPAERLRQIRDVAAIGLCLPSLDVRADWSAIQHRRRENVARRGAEWLELLQQIPELELMSGRAIFLGPDRVLVRGEDGDAVEVGFGQAIIATGASPRRPDIPGIDHHRVLAPEALMALDHLPRSITVLGGAPAGVELAQIFHAFGTEVRIVDTRPNLLPGWDAEVAELLRRRLLAEGIGVDRGSRLKRISNTGGGVFVEYDNNVNEPEHHLTEHVLLAMGRRPNVDGLDLESADVRYRADGIEVDETLRSSNPAIYAIGDVTGHALSARFAWLQGRALAYRLLGEEVELPDPMWDSGVVGSFPEIGRAGLTEEQAEEAGIDYAIIRYDLSRHYHSHLCGEQDGLLKVLYEHGRRNVIGVHALGDGASELMALSAVVLRGELTLDILANSITPQSTLGEALAKAAALAPEVV